MSTTVIGEDVRRYVEAVRAHLGYLRAEDRDELLEDLEEHLLEVAEENDGTLEQRLGPAPAYAEELRASAGLPEPKEDAVARMVQRLSRVRPLRAAAAALDSPHLRALRAFTREFGPGWWVLRGYLGVLTLGVIATRNEGLSIRESIPIPRILGSYAWGVVLTAAAIAVSMKVGRVGSRDKRAALLSLAATVVVLAAGFTVASDLGYGSYAYAVTDDAADPDAGALHHADGTAIANVCPYSADGKLLTGVLLFDQFGRPITNTAGTADNRAIEQAKPAILNVYPKAISFVEFRGETYDPNTGATEAQKTLTPLQCPASVTAGPAVPSPIPSTGP
ncbi:MAG: hypothetical protein WAT66_07685 [Actinomycetota bacterium]